MLRYYIVYFVLATFAAANLAVSLKESQKELEQLLPSHPEDAPDTNLTLSKAASRSAAKNGDIINEFNFVVNGGSLSYKAPFGNDPNFINNQAMGVGAMITKAILDDQGIGSSPYYPAKPPGYDDIANQGGTPNRGHLLGNQLGGSGREYRNIVALHRGANDPAMKHWENRVRNVYNSGKISASCKVWYTVTPYYQNANQGSRKHPETIWMSTWIYNPNTGQYKKWFGVLIYNEIWSNVANSNVQTDAEAAGGLFPMTC